MTTTLDPAPLATTPVEATTAAQLQNIIMTTGDLPAMPQVAAKVLELSSDPNTTAWDLQKVIADDPAMTGRILKIANSAMYNCSREVKTLSEAIGLLGSNSLRSLVATSAARTLYNTHKSRTGLKERLLWEHAIGTAFAARLIAGECAADLAEEAFLAGLMHDIGKLVLNQGIPEQFDRIVQVVYNKSRSFHTTETELLGYDHAHAGALLVNKWKLSPELEFVIRNHHNQAAMTAENPLLLFLDLANKLCRKLGIGFVEDPGLDLANCRANQLLRLGPDVLERIATELRETLENEMEIFV